MSHALQRCALVLLPFAIGCTNANNSATPAPSAPNKSAVGNASTQDVPAWAGQRTDEPFDVRAFIEGRSEPEENAAPLYVKALAPVYSDPTASDGPPLEKEIGLLAVLDKLAAGQVASQQIDDLLRKTAPMLAEIDAAQRKPKCVFVTPLRADALMPHAQAARSVSRLALLQLEQSRRTGDFESAVAAIGRALRLSRDLQLRGHEVCQLVSIAMEGQVLSGIERLTMMDPNLTTNQIDRLLALLADHKQQTLNRADEGLKVNFIQSRNSTEDIQSGRLSIAQIAELLGGPRRTPEELQPSAPPNFNYETEAAACNQLYQLAIAAAAEPPCNSQNLALLRAELERRTKEIDAFKQTVAAAPADKKAQLQQTAPSFLCFMWIAPVEPLIQANCRATAQLAGLQMLLAMRRYEIARGTPPDSLQPAVADCAVKTIPNDPYDGQPLRFAMVEGRPTAYSIGKDCQDDGGLVDWNFGTRPGDYRFVLSRVK